jgi:tetratricopeptide (TPR) repeat protein
MNNIIKAACFEARSCYFIIGHILFLFHIADCQFQSNRFEDAIESLQKLQNIYNNVAGFRAVYYPKSYYLLGKIYEKIGNKKQAIKNYQKFLEIWKDADKDLPELIDAETRFTKVKGLPL